MCLKFPLDRFPYSKDPRSHPIRLGLEDGDYVYVQAESGEIFVLPDGPHLHPKVLGSGNPAKYAGDLSIQNNRIVSLTNLSGTFQFHNIDSLKEIARKLLSMGFIIESQSVRYFDPQTGACHILE